MDTPKRKIVVEGVEFFVTDDVTDDDIAAFVQGQRELAKQREAMNEVIDRNAELFRRLANRR